MPELNFLGVLLIGLIIGIFAGAVLALFSPQISRAGLAVLRPFIVVVRLIIAPPRWILRKIGIGGRGRAEAVAGLAEAADGLDGALTGAMKRTGTLTEAELGDEVGGVADHIETLGVIFKWFRVDKNYSGVAEELTPEVEERYAKMAEELLSFQVPISADPGALYEDVEGSVIAKQIKNSDASALYVLNLARKKMNANIRRLALWFSVILATALGLNIALNEMGVVDMITMFPDRIGPMAAGDLKALVVGGIIWVIAGLIMWSLYTSEYSPYQRYISRELAQYLTRYMAQLNDHYRTAIGKAQSITVGQERDAKDLSERAKQWTLTITWLALRFYFIETYVRNVTFQFQRNSGYYLAFVPMGIILVLSLFMGLVYWATGFNVISAIWALGWVFAVLSLTVVGLYISFLNGAVKFIEELKQGEWISFHTLKLNTVLGDVVGKYAEDVGYWKNRIGGGL
jgi:hypothetical protein